MDFFLQHIGLVALVLSSGIMLFWPELQSFLRQERSLGSLEAVRLINQRHALVLDLRRSADFELGHPPKARHIPADEIAARASELERFKARPVILITSSSTRIGVATKTLQQLGYTDVFVLRGGMSAWVEANLPVETK